MKSKKNPADEPLTKEEELEKEIEKLNAPYCLKME
jgi:hypothetical protein